MVHPLRQMGRALVYTAVDRSILLPFYKRWLVEPVLPFIPARVHPNTITHLGHALCFAGAALPLARSPSGGWEFVATGALLQAYLWCDNADGAHARRTGQSTPLGEFLDHGLDILNTVYIAVMTVMIFRGPDGWTVGMVMVIPAAAGVTIWEQTATGVYQLGLLNQIESCMVVTLSALGSAFFGTSFWRATHLGPVPLWLVFYGWSATAITFGYARALFRVKAAGAAVAPALLFLGLQASVVAAACLGEASVVNACCLVTAANVYFGVRMLGLRIRAEQPTSPPLLTAGFVGALAWLACRATGHAISADLLSWCAAVLASLLAALAVFEAQRGVRLLGSLDDAAAG